MVEAESFVSLTFRGNRCRCDIGSRQLDHKSSTSRHVVFRANDAVVFGDYATGDRQSQAGSSILSREMRQEQLVLVFRRNPVAAVGHDDLHGIMGGVKARA